MAEFREGRLADILYVQFYAHDVKPRFLAEVKKEISKPQTEMVVGLEIEKDLEDERRRVASISSLLSLTLSLFSSIQVWMSDRQVSREDIAH